jgi:hypothetical protein
MLWARLIAHFIQKHPFNNQLWWFASGRWDAKSGAQLLFEKIIQEGLSRIKPRAFLSVIKFQLLVPSHNSESWDSRDETE